MSSDMNHVEGAVANRDDYLKHKQFLYPDHSQAIDGMAPWLKRQDNGDAVICGSPDTARCVFGHLPHIPSPIE